MGLEQQPQQNNAEKQRKLEAIRDASDNLKNVHEKELTKAEKSHGEGAQVEHIRSSVEKHAAQSHELSNVERAKIPNHHPVLVNKQLKDTAYSRALTRAQKRLSPPSRVFSKVIHSSAVERPSEAIGKTVARPSSMLGGALFALVGTSILLWITRRFGYEYNYLAVVLLFGVGMIVGLLVEGAIKTVRRSR